MQFRPNYNRVCNEFYERVTGTWSRVSKSDGRIQEVFLEEVTLKLNLKDENELTRKKGREGRVFQEQHMERSGGKKSHTTF